MSAGFYRLRTPQGLFAALALGGCALLCAPMARADRAIEPVNALRAISGAQAPALSNAASRNRVIGLDLDAIAPDSPSRGMVEFRLFDDAVFRATRQSVSVLEEGRWSWVGALENDPFGVVQFAVRDGVASGVIRSTERGVFRVRPTGEPGVYVAEEIDIANLEPCATGPDEAVVLEGEERISEAEALERFEASPRGAIVNIDVLVGYTAEARTLGGGTSGILAEIDLAIASANLAYQNSNVDINLTLVLTYLALYNESGDASTDLFHWREPDDGFMDSVHVQRDDIAADMCALIVGDINACGIGNLMTTPSVAFENRAFTVTELSCAVNNLSFAHELGHNLGCAHDRDNASTGAYSFSFGYRDPIGTPDWRTIMAYAPGTRIQYFSNPLVAYMGQLLGVLSGSNAADNAKTLNLTNNTAAQWRDESTRRPLAFGLNSPNSGAIGVTEATEFAWEANGPVDGYSFIVATDSGLANEVYRVDGLLDNEASIPAGELDGCATYYWGVVATLAGNPRSASPASRSFTTRLLADINGDSIVDTADLGGLVGAFGTANPFADINKDGVVNTADLGILIGHFGTNCAP